MKLKLISTIITILTIIATLFYSFIKKDLIGNTLIEQGINFDFEKIYYFVIAIATLFNICFTYWVLKLISDFTIYEENGERIYFTLILAMFLSTLITIIFKDTSKSIIYFTISYIIIAYKSLYNKKRNSTKFLKFLALFFLFELLQYIIL